MKKLLEEEANKPKEVIVVPMKNPFPSPRLSISLKAKKTMMK